jgi:hypothetical protein
VLPAHDLFSSCCGTAQRLANGNTRITETDAGRALEVTRDGTIVWEYVRDLRAPSDPGKVARLFEVERMPYGFGADWLVASADAVDAESRSFTRR